MCTKISYLRQNPTSNSTHHTIMSGFVPINPKPFLQDLINQQVVVRLKWDRTEYIGLLISVDSYMNVQLAKTEEFIDGKSTGTLGEVMIRCNNVLWICGAESIKSEAKMEED